MNRAAQPNRRRGVAGREGQREGGRKMEREGEGVPLRLA